MQNYDNSTVEQWLARMRAELLEQLGGDLDEVGMIGIHTGGVRVAEALHRDLKLAQPLGSLSISFYRDDFSRIGLHPQVAPMVANVPLQLLAYYIADRRGTDVDQPRNLAKSVTVE